MLTQERLKEVLDYDPVTGIFTNRIRRSNAMPGVVAGNVNPAGYRTIMIDRKFYYAHHLAVLFMTGELPPKGSHVDHRNGNEDQNWWDNLRITTPVVNLHNRKGLNKNNSSGVAGVSFSPRKGRFRACIGFERRQIHIGYFATLEQAAAAREAFRATLPIGQADAHP